MEKSKEEPCSIALIPHSRAHRDKPGSFPWGKHPAPCSTADAWAERGAHMGPGATSCLPLQDQFCRGVVALCIAVRGPVAKGEAISGTCL